MIFVKRQSLGSLEDRDVHLFKQKQAWKDAGMGEDLVVLLQVGMGGGLIGLLKQISVNLQLLCIDLFMRSN